MEHYDRRADDPAERLLTHDEARELLPAYVADLALRSAQPALQAAIAAHLRACAACREEVDELTELLREAAAGALPAAPAYPDFDLGFLRPQAPSPWSVDQLGRIVVRFSAALLDLIRPAALPAPARSAAGRGPQLYHYDHARFAQAGRPQSAALTIAVFGVGGGPDTVDVVVRVGVPGRRATDLAGSEVTIALGASERRDRTDRFGYATFPGVPAAALPQLQVTVAPTGGRSA